MNSNQNTKFTGCRVILVDIEGTTTSISFVKDELFPYILNNIRQYLDDSYDSTQTQEDIDCLRQLALDDVSNGVQGVIEIAQTLKSKTEVIDSVVSNVEWQMSYDRKSTALKQLQGHMWMDAYKHGHVKGHLYPEVAQCLNEWKNMGKIICVYSSGSVEAQKLLFKYSVDGDLTNIFTNHFDTKVGGKREKQSYKNIADLLEVDPGDILFLTDIIEEARAAREAGLSAMILMRPGNAELSQEQLGEFETLSSFKHLSHVMT